jgi:hypothetical protein
MNAHARWRRPHGSKCAKLLVLASWTVQDIPYHGTLPGLWAKIPTYMTHTLANMCDIVCHICKGLTSSYLCVISVRVRSGEGSGGWGVFKLSTA